MNRIDTVAQRLRDQLGIPDDIRLETLDVLRRMKISKAISDYREDSEAAGRDARWDADGRIIHMSPELWTAIQATNDNDARFTVLHEVGHAVLGHTHRNRLTNGKLQHGKTIEADESDADQFALAFAIPLKFAEEASSLEVATLADMFGLPPNQASRRLVDLQRHMRVRTREAPDLDSDSYADAMSAMRINAINWNS